VELVSVPEFSTDRPGIPVIETYPMPAPAQLPNNVASWQADSARAVLLIHDMQRFFLARFPSGEPPVADLLVNASRLREHCAARGMPVCYTAQPGSMTERQRGLLRDFWGPGMRVTSEDRAVVPELAPDPQDWVLTKWRYSAFHRSDLLHRLKAAGRDQLIVCGVYAHIGVLATAVDAFSHDIAVFLAADAVADFSAVHHDLALRFAAQRCAVVSTTDALLAQIDTRSRAALHATG
jgi:trans-2,3-dihydro-3-hydroxyanthranilic acid synthase